MCTASQNGKKSFLNEKGQKGMSSDDMHELSKPPARKQVEFCLGGIASRILLLIPSVDFVSMD
jgi:hypothetical protein